VGVGGRWVGAEAPAPQKAIGGGDFCGRHVAPSAMTLTDCAGAQVGHVVYFGDVDVAPRQDWRRDEQDAAAVQHGAAAAGGAEN
jgi:hypothetical protein